MSDSAILGGIGQYFFLLSFFFVIRGEGSVFWLMSLL
jgi:hypothetical protein